MTVKYIVESDDLIDAVKAFDQLNIRIPTNALRRAGERIGRKLKLLLERPTNQWSRPPSFDYDITPLANGMLITIDIDDEPYVYVTLGTRPHRIEPRGNYPLRFQSGYIAKTIPGFMTSQAGGAFGNVVFARGVNHPGIEARNFHILAVKILRKDAVKIMAEELNKEIAVVMARMR